ncbi:Uncharacterised protein [Mycobacteroides abscessus subsp. abscessus]|nr:Uncharacterised protein [Mycobacteroides abscessus subsp. abscessus]
MGAVVGGRCHQDVITIRDDHRIAVAGQPLAQSAFDVVDLTHAVELIPAEIEEHDDRRVDRVGDVWHVHLVDLEHRDVGLSGPGQGGNQTGVHVGALGVGCHWPHGRQGGGGHPGGGGLAVGAGYQDCPTTSAQLRQHRAIQLECDEPADHGARAATADPGCPPRGGARGECDPATRR